MSVIEIDDNTCERDDIKIESYTSDYTIPEKSYHEIYKTYIIKNVCGYYMNTNRWNTWCVLQNDRLQDKIDEYYFIINCVFTEAVGHWMYESCIYLDLFKVLKLKYPSIKLVIGQNKMFKTLFLNFFDINSEYVVESLPSNCKTTCIFPSPIMLLNDAKLMHLQYMWQLEIFWKHFKPKTISMPTIKYLILPRQTKENYKINDRSIELKSIINWFQSNNIEHTILHTDEITDLQTQMKIIQSAETIILTDGSPCWINGMFAYNKHIIVAGHNVTTDHDKCFAKVYLINKLIKHQNKSVRIIHKEEDVIRFLQESHQT